jgi:hypothetical protein
MMADVISDTDLSCMARFIMLWILRNPSEAINPEQIAEENRISVKQVKTLLTELADTGYLVKPARIKGERGRFDWTPYTLNPSYGQPFNGDPSHGQPEHGSKADGTEYARTHTGAAGAGKDKELLKELKEIQEIDLKTNQSNSLKLKDTSASTSATMTEAQIQATIQASSQAAKDALSRSKQLTSERQDTPNPDAAEPLPPEVKEAYLKHWGRTAIDDKEQAILHELIGKHGELELVAIIEDADKIDWKGNSIKNPAAWIRKVGAKTKITLVKKADDFDMFAQGDEPGVRRVTPVAPCEPVDPGWQGLSDYIQITYPILYGDYFKGARFGGFEGGVLKVKVQDIKAYRGCFYTLNHQKQFERWSKDFWTDLTEVIFVIERLPDAHPETR